ncbi:LacI family DNA-binding transcriptional regulator [Priestia flexa]|uniref:LacI family DNA-binding transcriptional regulator n=1 Tax=Priestia TaxID=2800373 RepID=UPI000473069F|nr:MULTISPECIES: LacI family DNA-binding transcriptional regulator [Priestia]MBY6086663.1 LacI family DNA-binding transcriptional regulator [Priestia flexa]MCA1203777.1 LacI family DNA-binding transcriptional regulator [Priestia flexa]MCG7314420.1 LacI family DNA-binding transcriptional regulator [Priestia flexa]MED4589722.1 LacI family DNA-binding transcriptional regulator [Priestia flexa]WHX79691.1 LacI family DNA-binding transcriptional regulator [Priestia flexa]
MSVTIKDVANLAKVAPSTVSRVIANSSRISEKTKQRVRAAMEELGYHPNIIARNLANKTTEAIGIVMPSSAGNVFQNPFFPEVLRGISTGAHEKKRAIYMSTGEAESEILREVMQMVQGRRVDGLILLYSKIDDPVLAYLKEQNIPFVVVGKPFKDSEYITYVDNDNFKAGKEATEYLIELGHNRIAFIGGSLDLVVTIDRLTGYDKAIQGAGIAYRSEYVIHEEFLQEGGKEAVCELLSLEERPTALVVADDLMALGVLNTLDAIGISVPEDMSIISFNNVLIAEMARPALTSIDINIFELGYQAVRSLTKKIEASSQPIESIRIPHSIVTRQSCKKR